MTDSRAPASPPSGDATRVARLRMRSWRRGTREMDLILGPYADAALPDLGAPELDAYEAILSENDQDLYLWITRPDTAPPRHARALWRIRAHRGLG